MKPEVYGIELRKLVSLIGHTSLNNYLILMGSCLQQDSQKRAKIENARGKLDDVIRGIKKAINKKEVKEMGSLLDEAKKTSILVASSHPTVATTASPLAQGSGVALEMKQI